LILAVVAVYLLVVMVVGLLGHRLFRGTGEDFFLASRSIGSFVLLMTLFGTHMTAFTILGASGEAYREGIGVFALMASSSSITVPLVFYFLGTRLWWLGKRLGYQTQVQFFRDRFQSDLVGLLLFVVLLVMLLPYVLIGVRGGGDALAALTGGPNGLPRWVGSVVVCGVVFVYVTYGGMRSTSWVNTFQTSVFMTVAVVTFMMILKNYGGLEATMEAVRTSHPELVVIGGERFDALRMLSYLLIPLSVGVFPHIFNHWLSAERARAFRRTMVWYPICIVTVWAPVVLLGIIGRIDYPEPPPGPILVALILDHSGELAGGLLAAGIFATIMSSVDSQVLAAGTLFTQDIVRHYGYHDVLSEERQVMLGRFFVAGFLLVTFYFSLHMSRSIFSMGTLALSGFAGLFPVVVAAVYWKRSTAWGIGSGIAASAGLWTFFVLRSLSAVGEYTVGGTGLMPVVVIFAATAAVVVMVSLLTTPPPDVALHRFFPETARTSDVDAGQVALDRG
jgi:SSS family solute:Na+ symporter